MDLEVWWDGSHKNRDADLLCAPAIPLKRYDVPISPEGPTRLSPTQMTVLRALEPGAATVEDLMAATGFTKGSVVHSLGRLRLEEIVTVRARVQKKGSGSLVCVYALVAEGA